MTISLRDLERAICCPNGKCCSPTDCYAEDRSRAVPVKIRASAQAVQRLLHERFEAWIREPKTTATVTVTKEGT